MIVFIPGLFRNLPQPALAAVVITASLSLADIPGTVRLWRQRKTEFGLSIAAFLGVALLGVLPGIAIAVGLSILNVFRRAWWPYDTELGRVEGLPGYHEGVLAVANGEGRWEDRFVVVVVAGAVDRELPLVGGAVSTTIGPGLRSTMLREIDVLGSQRHRPDMPNGLAHRES
jgi:MFS superfamily sulfate permease-like transporter